MIAKLVALIAGLLFGFGLILSGMYDPAKVFGFLDLAGAWDPSLAFVMGGAIIVALPAFALSRRRGRDLTGAPLDLPDARPIDAPLILGALIFGVGWGLSGVCPGPGLADLGFLSPGAVIFVASMAAGVAAHRLLARRLRVPPQQAQDA